MLIYELIREISKNQSNIKLLYGDKVDEQHYKDISISDFHIIIKPKLFVDQEFKIDDEIYYLRLINLYKVDNSYIIHAIIRFKKESEKDFKTETYRIDKAPNKIVELLKEYI